MNSLPPAILDRASAAKADDGVSASAIPEDNIDASPMNRLLTKLPWLASPLFLAGLYLAIVAFVTIRGSWIDPTTINNFTIFRWSFPNLIHGVDLYSLHPDQHEDLYKYSPTFALFMAPFHILPRPAGLLLWNILNAFVPFWAIQRLKISAGAKSFILLFISMELLGSMQNTQSNGLMAGLIIGTLASLERRQVILAALLVCLGFYIKVFGAAAGILFLMYDRKPRFLIACGIWGLLLAAAPLPITGLTHLIELYKGWLHLMATDPAHDMNHSLMTLTQSWFHIRISDVWYLTPGLALLLLPLARRAVRQTLAFRILYCGALLVWVVIFNHKAESPTYIIAMCGVALWAITEPPSILRTLLVAFVFILTSMSGSDLFPSNIRENYVGPYHLKALPCILAWLLMTWQLLTSKERLLSALSPADSGGDVTRLGE